MTEKQCWIELRKREWERLTEYLLILEDCVKDLNERLKKVEIE